MKNIKYIIFSLLGFFLINTLHGQTDYCLSFQPGDKVETLSSFSAINNLSALTIEAEVTVDSLTDWTHLLSKVIGSTDRLSVQYHQGKIYCIVANGANTYSYSTNSIIALGVKYHISMVYDGTITTKIKLYLDGVLQTLTTSGTLPATTPTNTAVFRVGDPKFKGKIDEVRVWNYALSSTVINNWKDSTINTSHPDYNYLLLYWNFNNHSVPDTAYASQNTIYNGVITGAYYIIDSSNNPVTVDSIPADTIVGGYLPYYSLTKVTPDIFDYLTHVFYFSLHPDASGNLGRVTSAGVFTQLGSIPSIDTDITTLLNWRGTKPSKIFVTIGGWVGSYYFDEAVANATARANLVANIKSFCQTYGIDGVVIDWEGYNGSVNDTQYGFLITELKTAFAGTSLQISAAINPTHTSLANAFSNVDFIQLMSYGAYLSQNTQVPLSQLQGWVDGWVNAGYNKAKIVIGLPAYGRTPVDGTSVTYRQILHSYNPTPAQDTVTVNNKLYYYNGIYTIMQKTQYAVNYHLRGVMIWELGQDTIVTDPQSLINAINTIIPVYLNTVTEISTVDVDPSLSFSAFPNPFTSEFQIGFDLEETSVVSFSLIDLQGKILWTANHLCEKGYHKQSVNIGAYHEGYYILKLRTYNNIYQTKLLKLHQ